MREKGGGERRSCDRKREREGGDNEREEYIMRKGGRLRAKDSEETYHITIMCCFQSTTSCIRATFPRTPNNPAVSREGLETLDPKLIG